MALVQTRIIFKNIIHIFWCWAFGKLMYSTSINKLLTNYPPTWARISIMFGSMDLLVQFVVELAECELTYKGIERVLDELVLSWHSVKCNKIRIQINIPKKTYWQNFSRKISNRQNLFLLVHLIILSNLLVYEIIR